MTNFWQDFWPNFFSTVIGLLLGLPLALWTDRWLASRAKKEQVKNEQERLRRALQTLAHSLGLNRERMQNVQQALSNQQVPFDPALDYSAWDVVKLDVINYLHDPELQHRVAYFFSRMETIVKLNDLFLNFAVGTGATITGSNVTRDKLRNYLIATIQILDKEAGELIVFIEANKLAPVQRQVNATEQLVEPDASSDPR